MSAAHAQPPRVPGVRALWVLATVFIVYGTLLPFEPAADRAVVLDNLTRIPLNPLVSPDTGEWTTASDLLQNLLLFVPFGLAAALALGTDDRPRIGAAVALATALSTMVELCQLFTTGRVAAPADVLTNAAGAWMGARVAALVVQGWRSLLQSTTVRLWSARPAAYPAVLALFLLVAGALAPLDFTIDLWALVRKAQLWLIYPLQFSWVRAEPLEAVRAATASGLLAVWGQQAGARRPELGAVSLVALVVLGLEVGQLGVESRMPGLADAAAGLVGALLGGVAARLLREATTAAGVRVVVLLGTVASTGVLCASASRCDLSELALAGAAIGAVAVPRRRSPLTAVPLGALAGLALLLLPLQWQASVSEVPLDVLALLAGTASAAAGAWVMTAGQERYRRLASAWFGRVYQTEQ